MYVSSDVAERVKNLAKMRGISLGALMRDAGLGSNTMANFKTSMPKSDTLAKLADCLNCSVDYLLGRSDTISLSETQSLSDDEKWMLAKFRELDSEGAIAVRGVLLAEHRRTTAEKGTGNAKIG